MRRRASGALDRVGPDPAGRVSCDACAQLARRPIDNYYGTAENLPVLRVLLPGHRAQRFKEAIHVERPARIGNVEVTHQAVGTIKPFDK